MIKIDIPKRCTVSFISENISAGNEYAFHFDKDSSFSFGGAGMFFSILNSLSSEGMVKYISIYLNDFTLSKYDIRDDSPLLGVYMILACVKNVPILLNHGKDVTDSFISALSSKVNIEYGLYDSKESYTLFAIDPYFIHPPALTSHDGDPSEEDFRSILKEKILAKLIGYDPGSINELNRVVSTINIYAFVKELWENTVHHARNPSRSIRYIRISKNIFSNEEDIISSKLSIGVTEYFLHRLRNDKKNKYLIIEIGDSGSGIYQSLKDFLPELSPENVVKKSFEISVTSKKQRSSISRGVGLRTALDCALSLNALFLLTSSDFICSNYDYKNDHFSRDIDCMDVGIGISSLSTSATLIIPV